PNTNVFPLMSDPRESGSSFLFCAIIANALNGGAVFSYNKDASAEANDKAKSIKQSVWEILGKGHMRQGTGDVFNIYWDGGPQKVPLALGYENQLIARLTRDRNDPRDPVVIYLKGTIESDHPILALTDDGAACLHLFDVDPRTDQIKDQGIRELVERNGFRVHG